VVDTLLLNFRRVGIHNRNLGIRKRVEQGIAVLFVGKRACVERPDRRV
jgi:hypothetical protein